MTQARDLFLDSLKSPETRKEYSRQLKRFKNWSKDQKGQLQEQIIEYIVQPYEGLSYGCRNTALSAIRHYYSMNDVILNWFKIRKFMGEAKQDNDLRGYSHEEIKVLVDYADIKYRAIILLLASTGMRRAAVTSIRMKDMEYLDDYKLYKIRIYPKTSAQQICFTTPEAAKAIDLYIKNRRERQLIRITPDTKLHDVQPKALTLRINGLRYGSGLERYEPEAENAITGQKRREIPAVHGLRKFAATQMGLSDMKVEPREILLGHSIGVRQHYQRYSDEALLHEYLKAVDLLTINEENKLRKKVEILEEKERDLIKELADRLDYIETKLGTRD
jgi:integrase